MKAKYETLDDYLNDLDAIKEQIAESRDRILLDHMNWLATRRRCEHQVPARGA